MNYLVHSNHTEVPRYTAGIVYMIRIFAREKAQSKINAHHKGTKQARLLRHDSNKTTRLLEGNNNYLAIEKRYNAISHASSLVL